MHVVVRTAVTLMVLLCLTSTSSDTTDLRPFSVDIAGCPNVFAPTAKLMSGGQPEGDTAFKALADAGVKTLISVDGARPYAAGARKYGIRYVHIPIGYDGITREQSLRLARAVRDLPGRIYIHCHHGKHRSPAALANVLVSSQAWSADQAVAFMQQAGTSKSYLGLYKDVQQTVALDDAALENADASFPEIAEVPDLVAMMVELERRLDALSDSKANGWNAPVDHPDVVATHEALQVRELFREGARLHSGRSNLEYAAWMKRSEAAAENLEKALRMSDPNVADASYEILVNTCTLCHDRYRN